MHELHQYRRMTASGRDRVRIRWVPVLVTLAAFSGFIWLATEAYKAGSSVVDPADVPLVTASTEVFRIRPEEPGGMAIPHRDKQVFDALKADGSGNVEEIRPVPPPEATTTTNNNKLDNIARQREALLEQAEKAPEKQVEVMVAPDAPTPPKQETTPMLPMVDFNRDAKPEAKQQPSVTEQKTAEPPSPPSQAETAKPEPAAKPEATKQEAAAAEAVKPASQGNFRAQLAAFRSEAEVLSAWGKLAAKHPNAFAGKKMHREKVEVKDKGVFYRLQVASFSSKEEAKSFCQTIQQGGCIIVGK